MRKMKRLTALAMAAVVLLAGCSGSGSASESSQASGTETSVQSESAEQANDTESEGAQSAATGDPIKIGVSDMVTGPMAAGGLRMQQAITMAFEEINGAGGVLEGRPLEMVLVDDTGTPTGAVNAVNKILGENVVASIGPHTSPMASATQELYRKAGVPFVTAATSPSLLEAENPYFFRISVSDGDVGPVMVAFAVEQFNCKKIGAIYDTDDYGVAANNVTKAYCEENGIEYYSEGFTTGDKDLTSQLSKIKAWGPDVFFDFAHDAESALTVRQLDELGMGDIPHIGSNALAQAQTYDLCDAKQLEGTFASTDFYADTTNETMNEFLEKFRTRWGEEAERYAAMYYTAAYLVADAIERAGSDDPEAIRTALSETQGFQAIFGELNCTEQGEMNTNLYILEFDGEKNMTVAQQVSLN